MDAAQHLNEYSFNTRKLTRGVSQFISEMKLNKLHYVGEVKLLCFLNILFQGSCLSPARCKPFHLSSRGRHILGDGVNGIITFVERE